MEPTVSNLKDRIYSRKNVLLFYLIYKVVLDLIYIYGVNRLYYYNQFNYNPSMQKNLLSFFFLFISVLLIPSSQSLSTNLVNLFLIISFVPSLSFYWLADKSSLYIIYIFLFVIIVETFSKSVPRECILKHDPRYYNSTIINCIFVLYLLCVVYLGVKRGGIDSRTLSFKEIYGLRQENTNLTAIEGYLISWCTKAIFPILLSLYLHRRKYVKAVLCIIAQLFAYVCFGFKAYILSIILVIGIFILVKKSENHFVDCLSSQTKLFTAISIPTFLLMFKNKILYSFGFFINANYSMRMIYEPAKNRFGYFEYFSTNSKLFFSEGLIGKLIGINYDYNEPIGFVLAKYISGNSSIHSNSNTGIISDSFANLGVLGIIIIAVLTALLFRLCDYFTAKTPLCVLMGGLSFLVITLNDNPFFTSILTNGWFVAVILLFIIDGIYESDEKPCEGSELNDKN